MSGVPSSFSKLSRNIKAENMSSKVSGFCMILFLVFFTLSSAALARRIPPAYPGDRRATQQLDVGEADKVQAVEDSCDGIGEEECLMRRTLAAHIDYIYTQKSNP